MKSNYRVKRETLEVFLKEQLIGPGAYNRRYHFKDDIESNDYYNSNLLSNPAILNVNEVIPEVPAYQYGTAILFPQTKYKDLVPPRETELEVSKKDNYENNLSADDENLKQDLTESLVSKQQNYPSEFGLTFVAREKADLKKDLTIELSFRTYRKITKTECKKRAISIYLPEYQTEIAEIIEKYFNSYFAILRKSSNAFVYLKRELLDNDFYDIDYIGLNNLVQDRILDWLKKCFGENLKELKSLNGISSFGIGAQSESLTFYTIGSKPYGIGYDNVITLFENQLISYLKKLLKESLGKYPEIKDLIKELEIFNQTKNVLNDLKSVFRKKSAAPIWQSEDSKLLLKLPEYSGSHIQRETPILVSEKYEGLRYSVQYLKSTKHDGLYIKVVIQNTETIELMSGEPPMLNKKDEANQKAYFGLLIKVKENKNDVLLPYNSPQFIAFDEEDNFNKLLYRKFLDYGEGYNTSVTWGNQEENLLFVATDFLPEEETPKVDFKPSKIENGQVVSRLKDDEVLSIRKLSTFSEANDEEIIDALSSFIDEYALWIGEKEKEVELESNKQLLLKQLKACRQDFNRLKRNIRLLENNKEALTSFRLMNTAMFMQLHQGKLKKAKSQDLVDEVLNEGYYKSIVIEEYKWRSFQLAFVLLNIDAFIKPENDKTVKDVFATGWPERNEIADLVWFPTGGGKTEAYLGIIAFCVIFRRFTKKNIGYGTAVIMRYTLRLLTLQQFQRATLLICALEVIRKSNFRIPYGFDLGNEKITIGLFVGSGSLPNKWSDGEKSMLSEFKKIAESLEAKREVKTNLPFTECPWCGHDLFIDHSLENVSPNHINSQYGITDELKICCNNHNCAYHSDWVDKESSLPLRLFDEDIYKYPPTLLFGTVDKFAALANRVSSRISERNFDSRRFFGWRGLTQVAFPPDLIIQDELHLLLGPLGTAVGLYEKAIDKLCTYKDDNGNTIKPKIITSTATTRNTDKQIFALFNRRSEIFPKQGIAADDSFFAYYERKPNGNYISNRKYIGVLPIGKTQVWMQLRTTSVALAHRLKFLKDNFSLDDILNSNEGLEGLKPVIDYYHTVLSYFNSLKEVGKTQSQLSHYLPGDVNYLIKNTMPWSFIDKITRDETEINYAELTGRLTGEEVKTNLARIEAKWELISDENDTKKLNTVFPPEFVISTNMISVGIDVSRFNTMIISSMPRNIAEYIQASSRVARDKEGIVFTIHHPFRSRDISHYQRFKEFHEKFYSYVEPISVTPFATKALDRYLAMFLAVLVRHDDHLELMNNNQVNNNVKEKSERIIEIVNSEIRSIFNNAKRLDEYLKSNEKAGIQSGVDGIISADELEETLQKTRALIDQWIIRLEQAGRDDRLDGMSFRLAEDPLKSLYISIADDSYPYHWKVGNSLREIAPSTVIKTVQQ